MKKLLLMAAAIGCSFFCAPNAQAAAGDAHIVSFTVTPTEIPSGGTVTISGEVGDASTQIYLVGAQYNFTYMNSPSFSQEDQLSQNVWFMMIAVKNGDTARSDTIHVTIVSTNVAEVLKENPRAAHSKVIDLTTGQTTKQYTLSPGDLLPYKEEDLAANKPYVLYLYDAHGQPLSVPIKFGILR